MYVILTDIRPVCGIKLYSYYSYYSYYPYYSWYCCRCPLARAHLIDCHYWLYYRNTLLVLY